MRHTLDAHRGNGGAFDRTQQDAAETRADGAAEPAFERLRRKHAVAVCERLGIGN